MRAKYAGVLALYSYFRGAEYPLGRLRALWEAIAMVTGGWPGRGRYARYIPRRPPTEEEAEKAKEIARQRGWLTDRGFVWESDPGGSKGRGDG